MNFHQWATNPVGKGSAQVFNRGKIILDLQNRAKGRDDAKGIDLTVYKKGQSYLLYFKLLSESWKDLWYDIVFTLSPPEGEDVSHERTIANYEMKIISNMPSFAYTYAYAANAKGEVVEFLKGKFPKIFWEQKPIVRNPRIEMGFEKSILLCVFYLTLKKYHYIDTLDKLSKGVPNLPVLYKKFMSFTDKMKDYDAKMKAHKAAVRKSGVHMTKHGVKRLKQSPIEPLKSSSAKAPRVSSGRRLPQRSR